MFYQLLLFKRPQSLGTNQYQAQAEFCRFDKADATSDDQGHCYHRPPDTTFPARGTLDFTVYWIEELIGRVPPVVVETATPYVKGKYSIQWSRRLTCTEIKPTYP